MNINNMGGIDKRTKRGLDPRQLDLPSAESYRPEDPAESRMPGIESEKTAIGGEIRLKVVDLLQPELNKTRNTKLAFVIYLLRKELGADTITLQAADLNMMEKLRIGIKYRNDGGTDIPIDAYEIPIVYPDGIAGSLTVDKGKHPGFVFNKSCRRGGDRKPKEL